MESFVTYHSNESFFHRVITKFRLSLILSIPFVMVFNNILSEILYPYYYSELDNFKTSLIITINLLLIVRIYYNPSQKMLIFLTIHMTNHNLKDNYIKNIYKNHKRRALNLSYVFLYGALFYIYIQVINLIIFASPFWIIDNIFYFSTLSLFYFIYCLNIYIVSIFILVLLSEIILLNLNPIIIED